MSKIFLCILCAFFVVGCKFVGSAGVTTTPQTNATIVLTTDEVAKHSTPEDCWIIIANKVYRVTDFLNEHPGGSFRITPFCGKDATNDFQTQGGRGSHSAEAYKLLTSLAVGELGATVQTPK